ncbi:hypothetical protein GJ496_001345 [Pomphorhynchus laevis]|nr:hypothetical protein GJ496_001345 [Pomphorhynchus laevis]
MVLTGEVPDYSVQVFYGACLTSLRKKDGGLKPIAVGCTLRRLACTSALKNTFYKVITQLRPIQIGFATKRGCEAAVHSTRKYIDTCSSPCGLLKRDTKNAFNTLRRYCMLKEALLRIPDY